MSQLSTLDANQVIKTVYDPSTGAMGMVPTYKADPTWFTLVPANASFTSSSVNVLPYRTMGLTISWAALSTAGGTLTFQGSTNGTNWSNIGSPYTLASTSGFEQFSVIDEPYQFVQIVYTPGATTSGTLSADYILRA